MTIHQNIVSSGKYSLKCPNPMTPVGICVHNTANDATASGEISYMIGNTSQTSFHLAVDDLGAWQGLPLDRNGWHAGDGNGDGNRKHIGIEICYSKSGGAKFDKAEENAVELIVQLLKERNWGVERVKKHQDFSGKYCPARTLDKGWDRFLNMIKAQLQTQPGETMYTEAQMTQVREERDKNWNLYQQELKKTEELQKKIQELEEQPTQAPGTIPGAPVVPGWGDANGLQVTVGNVTYNYPRKS